VNSHAGWMSKFECLVSVTPRS